MITSKHFSEVEFMRCTPSCSLQDMDQRIIDMWDAVRDMTGIPLKLNSAYRSVKYELSKGRTGTSAHSLGKAMDIACVNSNTRWRIVSAMIAVGFTRIGIGNTFIHGDCSRRHTQNVIWTYD